MLDLDKETKEHILEICRYMLNNEKIDVLVFDEEIAFIKLPDIEKIIFTNGNSFGFVDFSEIIEKN